MNLRPLNFDCPTAATLWKSRYEALRQLAVAGSQILGAEPLGLVVLLRQGVAGWMRAWPRPTESAAQASTLPPPSTISPPPQWQQQLTALLAQMTSAHLPIHSTP